MIKIWRRIIRSLAGRENCPVGKIEGMEKFFEKVPGKKSGRKRR
ncbi:MAG: hypothetical protein ABIB72_02285 [Candidatus Falkowbacteria bacterium]